MHRHLFKSPFRLNQSSLCGLVQYWPVHRWFTSPRWNPTNSSLWLSPPTASEYSEALQQQTLIGNVFVMQGSLKVRADKIIIYLKAGALDHFDASGQPTTFEQLDDNNQLVTGQANRIEYSATSDQAVFTGAAKLENPKQSLSGNRIDYNMATQAASAEMDEAGKQQVHIIIQPSTNQNQ